MSSLSGLFGSLFKSNIEKFFLFGIIAVIVLIPTGSYLYSQRLKAAKPAATPIPTIKPAPKEVPKDSPLTELIKNLEGSSSAETGGTDESKSTAEISFGPTVDFQIVIQGRPSDNHSAKIFFGVAKGDPQASPQYLLSFTIDVPKSGKYTGLSIAGLNQAEKYTAYLKAPAQIATASAFIVKPTVNNLGTFNLVTGDLNEDNVINSSDYAIAKAVYGTNPSSKNWNSNIDFNLDNVINNFDLAIILKNYGNAGTSGAWVSPTPKVATGSAQTATSSGAIIDEIDEKPTILPGSGGYWIWVPRAD